ncbi:MAG: ATP-dependent helicase [bacterium]|nr:ATP-dependent helicase [bacterium]
MKNYTLNSINSNNKNTVYRLTEDLNPAQLEAVSFDEGPLLVIAGAGSGKTKTIVHRVARLIASNVQPESILLLTFTRKAANEMLKRASHILDYRCQHITGGTFHSFANLILRRYSRHIGYDENFTIMDRSDSEDLISLIRKDNKYNKLDKRFPKKNTILNVISKSINTSTSISNVLSNDYPQFIEYDRSLEEINSIYQMRKIEMQTMDYDDLLTKLLDLLKTTPEVRAKLQQQFRYILVDEYQDTNAIQSEIINSLANEKKNVMAVGDDSQSIYSFRGADFKNIMTFPEMFPETKVITLEENYRSSQSILDITNAVIARAKEKYSKNLFTKKTEGPKPVYIETECDNEQSRFICQKILELREEGIELNDIAVLIRSGWHSNDLEIELKAHNLPFVKHGGFKFIETSHIKDVLSFFKIIYNPSDAISWQRILLLLEGLGPAGAQKIIKQITKNKDKPDKIELSSLKSKTYYKELNDLLKTVFYHKNHGQRPALLLESILTFYKPLFQIKYDDHHKRSTDLESLGLIAQRYQDLETFISEITLEPPDTSQIDSLPKETDKEKLTISTIHSAKGLEWNTVFLISAVDGYLPSFQSLGDLGQIEEERRLLYVALTRAKENLFIIKPNLDNSSSNYYRFSGMQFSKASRFLEEGNILSNYSEKWALVPEKNSTQIKNNTAVKKRQNKSNLPGFLQNSFTESIDDTPSADPNRKKYFL